MDTKDFGYTIRRLRTKAGKSVADVSAYLTAVGVKASKQTVYSWEAGRSQPTPDVFLDLCNFYGISDILGEFGYKTDSDTAAARKLDTAYASLNDEGRQRLVQYADDLAGMEKYKRTSEKPKKEPTIVLTAASDGSVGGSYVTDAEADIEKARQLGAQAAQREKDRRNYSKIHGKKPKR